MLWSVRVSGRRLSPPWEAWVERDGGMLRSTFSIGWTRERAERRTRAKWKQFQRSGDVPGTKQGVPL